MDQSTYLITFENISPAEANLYAQELREFVLNTVADAEVQRKRSDPNTQDLGTIVQIVLGSASVVALAKAIGDWLKLRQSVNLTFKRPDGDVVVKNVNNKTALKMAELLLKDAKESKVSKDS